MINIGIIGTRRRDNEADYHKTVRAFVLVTGRKRKLTIVSGGCPRGGDRYAELLADALHIPIKIHYPNESKLDSTLSPRVAWAKINYARNTLIAEDSDVLLACVAGDRKGGTEDTIKKFVQKLYGRHTKSNEQRAVADGKLVLI